MILADIAQVVRSKNAGPRTLTLDVMFPDEATYERVAASGAINAARVAELYGVEVQTVRVIPCPAGFAIKISMARPVTAGDPGDRDVYGAQQHAPLLELAL